jgi:CBS domain-containing protein
VAVKVATILAAKGDDVTSIGPDDQVALALHRMTVTSHGALVVIDAHGSVTGMISERDLVRGLARFGPDIVSKRVRDVMQHAFPACAPSDDIPTVMRRMTHSRHRHLPVLDHGRLCGLISIGDVVKHRLGELELETHVLRDVYRARV